MSRIAWNRLTALASISAAIVCSASVQAQEGRPSSRAEQPPNIVLILADDLGYSDVGCFGARSFKTPNLDRMAREGVRLTSFYVAQPVCTASRAALLTGSYANRVGLFGALNHTSTTGIHADELLLPEVCKELGYATAIYGKWHLGHRPEFNPTRHGFDEFFGIPYSNDNGPLHPVIRDIPALPLMEGERIVETDPDQSQFTRRFTERSVEFIERNREKPFVLYVPHVMPHVPIFASEKFRGRSGAGLYGDVIEELDWSVGEILKALKRHKVDERTLIIFASDNGPFLSYGEHAGSARPLREGKLTVFEGGVRVPCIARWPGKIPAGSQCSELVTAMDLLPTIARRIGANLPEHKIDGLDVWSLLTSQAVSKKSPRQTFYYYAGDELHAVRSGPWKLHLPHPYLTVAAEPGRGGKPSNYEKLKPASIKLSGLEGIASRHGYRVERTGLELYNLEKDVGETTNVAVHHPEIVAQLLANAEAARSDLGDSLTGRVGGNHRAAGKVDDETQQESRRSRPAEPAECKHKGHDSPSQKNSQFHAVMDERGAFEHHRPQHRDERRERQHANQWLNRIGKPFRRKEDPRQHPHRQHHYVH